MYRYRPTIYKKTIFDINYDDLYRNNIRCLLFDLDNTLGLITDDAPSDEVVELINKLKKQFQIFIVTNNNKKRIKPYVDALDIDFVSLALKPSTLALRKIRKKYNYKKEEMAIIGDQLVTDILAGNKYKITSILVDPLGKKDLKITSINRKIEKIILNRYKRKNILERGKYYD